MKAHLWIGAFLIALLAGVRGVGGERSCCEPPEASWLQRLHPVGGWNPYGGGLLHWWDPHCFPRCGTTDDYCRKKLPCVCWPPYPPYFITMPPECCASHGPLPQASDLPQAASPAPETSSKGSDSPKGEKEKGGDSQKGEKSPAQGAQ